MKLRLDIQKLRTFAVLGVVLFHLWPAALPGGFVGVDVFFVISGFLISKHLFDELAAGRFSFANFWARRARRILPSAVLVLAVTAVCVLTITLILDRAKAFKHLIASLLFAENWMLAADSVNYLAVDDAPLPTQHYWSLSVEEQFYLVWPVAIFLIYKLAKSRAQSSLRLAVALILLGSFGYSIVATFHDPSPAYFSTFTRVWEFCAGALVALIPRKKEGGGQAFYYTGWALLFSSLFLINTASVFPGYIAAVPVGGAALVIWARSSAQTRTFSSFTGKANVLISDVSFALYLWHWPVIVFANDLTGRPLDNFALAGLLLLSIALAWLTTRYVEAPIRFGKRIKAVSAPRFLTASLAGLALVAVTLGGGWLVVRADAAQALKDFESQQSHTGLLPDPSLASLDVSKIATGTPCASSGNNSTIKVCHFGKKDAAISVAVLGDSHMMALFPAVDELAKKRGWKITTYVRSACPFIGRHFVTARDPREKGCDEWNDKLRVLLAKEPAFDFVFVTANHKNSLLGTDSYGIETFAMAWQPLIDRGTKVVAVRDIPIMPGALECLQRHQSNPADCAQPANADILGKDLLFEAAKQTPGVYPVDLIPTLCPQNMCQIAIDGYTVLRDHGHLTATFAAQLAPSIEKALEAQHAFEQKG